MWPTREQQAMHGTKLACGQGAAHTAERDGQQLQPLPDTRLAPGSTNPTIRQCMHVSSWMTRGSLARRRGREALPVKPPLITHSL